jgi:hypothetical protein
MIPGAAQKLLELLNIAVEVALKILIPAKTTFDDKPGQLSGFLDLFRRGLFNEILNIDEVLLSRFLVCSLR